MFFNSHKFKILNFTLILPYFLENQRPRTRNCKKVIQISRKSREVPGQGRVKYYAQMLFSRDKRNNENKTFLVIPDPIDLLTGLSEASPSSATSFEVRRIKTTQC